MFLPAPPNFQKKKLAEEIQNLDPWPPKYYETCVSPSTQQGSTYSENLTIRLPNSQFSFIIVYRLVPDSIKPEWL